MHYRNKKAIERVFKIDLRRYKNIYIFHDDIMLAHYLIDSGIKYHLIEDVKDCFKVIHKTRDKILLLPKNPVKFFVKKYANYGYLACGQSRFALSIEVNDKNGIVIPLNKVIEVPKISMYKKLTLEDRKKYIIFL